MFTYVELPSGTVLETEHPEYHTEGKRLTKKAGQAKLRQEAADYLRSIIKPGDTVYCILRSVSRSGMFRRISLQVIHDNQPQIIDGYVSRLGLADRRDHQDGLGVSGCGMDMGFSLVYNLSRTLFQGGYGCIGKGCPSNDHSNGDRDYTPHYDGTPRNSDEVGKDLKPHSHYHSDGGYALRSSWL